MSDYNDDDMDHNEEEDDDDLLDELDKNKLHFNITELLPNTE